jgi:PKD repeat protein
VITLYDSRNNVEDTIEINEVYLHAIAGLMPLEITELSVQDGNEGAKLDFEGHVSDPNGLYSEEDIMFSWDFGDDSDLVEGYGLTTPKHIYQDDGIYTVVLTVSVDTLESSRVAFIFVSNVPPEIIGISQNGDKEGENVVLIGHARDVYYDNITYLWDFGDGYTATGMNVTHVFGDNGNYSVTLTVFDEDKSYNVSTFIVPILNVAPSISFEEANITFEGLTVKMEVAVYDVPADDLTVVWYFGDGSSETGGYVEHTYAEAGDYEASVCATDDDGGRTCQNFTVSVKSGGSSSPGSPLPSLSLPLAIFGLVLIALRKKDRF